MAVSNGINIYRLGYIGSFLLHFESSVFKSIVQKGMINEMYLTDKGLSSIVMYCIVMSVCSPLQTCNHTYN